MKKTFIFDIDGTLFNSQWTILPESIEALKAIVAGGDEFILASGRPVDSLRVIANDLPVKPIYLVGSNGAAVFEWKTQKIVKRQEIEQEFIDALLEEKEIRESKILFQRPEISFAFNYDQNDMTETQAFNFGATTSISESDLSNMPGCSLIALFKWKEKLWPKYQSKIEKLVKDHNLQIINMPDIDFVDIMPNHISKAEALKWIESKGLIDSKTSYTFGDGINDIQMLEWSQQSYALAEAAETTKQSAKEVIGSHNTPTISKKVFEILNKK